MSKRLDFERSFERLMLIEGGYTKGEGDPGGETNWGISKRSYPKISIKNLTKEKAKEIYFVDFWEAAHMDELNAAIAFQIFDAAVNHGIKRAKKLLQRAVGATEDGIIGPKTLAAIRGKSETDLLMLFIAKRLRFWTSLANYEVSGKGWSNRAASNLEYAAEDS